MLRLRSRYHLKRRRLGFPRNTAGSTAVEFALVAPVFLMMMFSIFEVGWFYFANSIVDAAIGDMARLIKTGQVQGWDGTDEEKYDQLYADVCNIVEPFGGCENRLTLEVDTYDTFAQLAADNTPATCADAPPEDLAALPFDPGEELQIIRVRVCYLYTTLNPAIGVNLAEEGSNRRRIISTMIFRNEPYELNSQAEE